MKSTLKSTFHVAPTALAIALLAVTGSAWAASTASIKVTGTITPAACNVSVTNDGKFDYGNISAGTLSDTQANNLGEKTNNLQITCSSPTQLALKTLDNAHASADGSEGVTQAIGAVDSDRLFGLGDTADGKQHLGAYTLALMYDSLTVNGTSTAGQLLSKDGGYTWINYGRKVLQTWDNTTWPREPYSWGEPGQTSPLATTSLSMPLKVTAGIKPLGKLPSGTELKLNGSTTIELMYL
jgi:type 1 fimbria pilin